MTPPRPRSVRPSRRACHAFTLPELLLVGALVVVLVGLVLGATGSVRENVNNSRCINNLRNYARQATLYAADNGGAIAVVQPGERQFQRFLPGYPSVYSSTPVWNCPSYIRQRSSETGQPPPRPLTIWWTGYHSNRYFADRSGITSQEKRNGYLSPGLMSQIKEPAKTPLYFDIHTQNSGEVAGGYISDGGGKWYYEFWAAHRGSFNIVFFDGHLERVTFNTEGPREGKAAIDYPQFTWKPY